MNAAALRTNLRTAGLEDIGRNLPSYLVEQGGPPVMREGHGLRVRIEADRHGRLQALTLTRDGWLIVADEERAHIDRERVRKMMRGQPTSDRAPVSFTCTQQLVDRLDRYRAGTGLSRSALIRQALAEYLEVRS